MGALWVLNLDAEDELARPVGYHPDAKTSELVCRLLPAARALLAAGDALLGEANRPSEPRRTGRAWCPTPRARRQLARAGAVVEAAPSLQVLQAVNHRRFAFELGPPLGSGSFQDTGEAALRWIEQRARGGPWLVKRAFGFAGRGQRRIRGVPEPDDRRWLLSRRSQAGLLIEPYVDIRRELAIHGWLTEAGDLRVGQPCEQRCDAFRAWHSTVVARDLPTETAARLRAQADRVAEALNRAGYFGPFGIDAYEYVTGTGQVRLHPLSEINARYTMGYATGMAADA